MTCSRWGKYYPHDTNVETKFRVGYEAYLGKLHKLMVHLALDKATFFYSICTAWLLFPDVFFYKRLLGLENST